ncbi:MAG: helix-turn-helix domain-containing protein [Flavobacteriales bacterium]
MRASKLKQSEIKQIVDLRNQGYSAIDISKEINRAPKTIYAHLKKMGIVRRYKRKEWIESDEIIGPVKRISRFNSSGIKSRMGRITWPASTRVGA